MHKEPLRQKEFLSSFEFRKKLATDAFLETAYYDSVISNWMNDLRDNKFPKKITIAGQLKDKLRYGENPHQQASVYKINYKNASYFYIINI